MTDLHPDDALQAWRDQIEENMRLQHVIIDRDVQVEKLARLNHDVLFEANRYKALYDAVTAERDYLVRVRATLIAKVEAIAGVAGDVARTIENLGDMALLAASAEPPAPVEPVTLSAPASAPISPDPLTDPALDLPAFLTDKGDHVTPLPQVVP